MMELKSAGVGNGIVQFQKKVEPTAETKETTANFTIVNVSKPGVPSHFIVTFDVDASFEGGGLEARNFFAWTTVLPSDDQYASYRSVEDRAARLIAPMLRSVADRIEAELPDYPKRNEKPADPSR